MINIILIYLIQILSPTIVINFTVQSYMLENISQMLHHCFEIEKSKNHRIIHYKNIYLISTIIIKVDLISLDIKNFK